MNQQTAALYDDDTDGTLDRREFLKKLAVVAGGATAANALLPLLEGDLATAQITPKDDPRLHSEYVKYPVDNGEARAYIVKPKGDAKLPGVVIIHENRGLNAHIEDVNRRIALEGFIAIAPDALSPVGGTPEDPDKAVSLINQLDRRSTVNLYVAAVKYLKTNPASNGKIGTVGFCWGGGMANQLAVHSGDLLAAVPYYGPVPAS